MGVSGSGKSTIGKLLAEKLGIPFFDGDDYHPAENISKMKAGVPLTDEDRYSWLIKLHDIALDKVNHGGCIIACSALKESYRKILMNGIENNFAWIFLEGTYDLIQNRLQERSTHFMPVKLLASQFDTLEIPAYAIRIAIDEKLDTIIENILNHLEH